MPPLTPTSPRLRFGAFELNPAAGQLRKNSTLLKLPPQPFRLLVLLTARAGKLVTRDEIRTSLWTDSTFVDFEHGIHAAVRRHRVPLRARSTGRLGTLSLAEISSESRESSVHGSSQTHRNGWDW